MCLLSPSTKVLHHQRNEIQVVPQGCAFLVYLSYFRISLRVAAVSSSRAAFGKASSAHGCAKEMINFTSLPESVCLSVCLSVFLSVCCLSIHIFHK